MHKGVWTYNREKVENSQVETRIGDAKKFCYGQLQKFKYSVHQNLKGTLIIIWMLYVKFYYTGKLWAYGIRKQIKIKNIVHWWSILTKWMIALGRKREEHLLKKEDFTTTVSFFLSNKLNLLKSKLSFEWSFCKRAQSTRI